MEGATAALSIRHELVAQPRRPRPPSVPAVGVDGPPGLAVLAACVGAFGEPPDLVISGINAGPNTGRSLLFSGTVGGALAGAMLGRSAMAVSCGFLPEARFDTAAVIACAAVPLLGRPGMRGTVLNLNVPDVDLGREPAISRPPPAGPSHRRARCQSARTARSSDPSSVRRASPTATARSARSASLSYSRCANRVAARSPTEPSQPTTAGIPAVTSAVASECATRPPPAPGPGSALWPPAGGRCPAASAPVAVRHADTNSNRTPPGSRLASSAAVAGRSSPTSVSIISTGMPGPPDLAGQLFSPWQDRCTTGIPPTSASR